MNTDCRRTATAPAKLNLFFEILFNRDDGYHEVATVTTLIDLYDTLVFHRRESFPEDETNRHPLSVRFDAIHSKVPGGKSNLVLKAVDLLERTTGRSLPVALDLDKNIPTGAGLGGGSSDAAVVLATLNEFFQLGLTSADLQRLGATLGSDVPLFLSSPYSKGTGRGEILEPLEISTSLDFILLKPPFELSTAAVYQKYNEIPRECPSQTPERIISALKNGSRKEIAAACFNRLERTAFELKPELVRFRDSLELPGVLTVRMTGSGTCFYAICEDRITVEKNIDILREKWRDSVFLCGAGSGIKFNTDKMAHS